MKTQQSRQEPPEALPIPEVVGARRTEHKRDRMEASCHIDALGPLSENLGCRVIGQEKAIEPLVCSFSRLLSGLNDPSRPLLTALLLGPTGVGKTETARSVAQALFGSDRALTRVNCEEYSHGHELSKLLGSPPGYVGFNIEPLLSQSRIDGPHRSLHVESHELAAETESLAGKLFPVSDDHHLSVILFDEIEKAHPQIWNSLLGILDDGMLTLGDNSTTDFTRSIVLMTSNVGSREMSDLLDHRQVGFGGDDLASQATRDSLRELALAAARKSFPFEFINRFDEILVYSPLEHEHLEQIFDKFLVDIHDRALGQAGVPLLLRVAPEAKDHIIALGTDLRFGARPLRRAIEHELVDPLSRFIASHRLHAGDVVEVELERQQLTFYRS